MYKVLLIDDENMALEYLQNLIDWNACGFSIVGCAQTTQAAIQLFQEYNPEILISDICMPGSSGLELCEYVLNANPSVKIMLLSAYQEFEYVRKALHLGAADYVLKYELTPELLQKKLGNLTQALQKEALINQQKRNKKLISFLYQPSIGRDIPEELNDFQSPNKSIVLFLLGADIPYKPGRYGWKKTSLSNPQMIEESCRSLFASTLLNTTWDDFDSVSAWKTDILMPDPEHILLLCSSETKVLSAKMLQEINQFQQKLGKLTGITWSLSYQIATQLLENIPRMYQQEKEALEKRFLLGSESVIPISEFSKTPKREVPDDLFQKELHSITGALDNLLFEPAIHCIHTLLYSCRCGTYTTECCLNILNTLLTTVLDWANKHFTFSAQPSPWIQPASICCLKEGEQEILRILRTAQKYLGDDSFSKYSSPVRKTILYLNKHYMEDISVNIAAENVSLSASHLSRIFKTETGKTLLEYLTDIRIETAKKLLSKENCKIYEIGEKVGYRTTQYFSEMFTKKTGVTPGVYRREAVKNYEIQY